MRIQIEHCLLILALLKNKKGIIFMFPIIISKLYVYICTLYKYLMISILFKKKIANESEIEFIFVQIISLSMIFSMQSK
jgi:hypothetical protein